MNAIFYFFVYQISRLPLSVLYVFSDFLYFLLRFVIGYRRKVIDMNLKNSFPEKSEQEILQIRNEFYKNFTDYLVETLKSFSISQEELDLRHTYTNLEAFKETTDEGKDTLMMAGHIFNWEWYLGYIKHRYSDHTGAVYHKIRNPFWNEKVKQMRERMGTINLDMKDTLRFMLKAPVEGSITYLFVADQSPKQDASKHWITFLNQETAVFNGFDKIARKKNMGVVFCKMKKIKRGYYHTTFERIVPEDGIAFKENEVIDQFFYKLQETIKEDPANWLWSHKRWKFKKEN